MPKLLVRSFQIILSLVLVSLSVVAAGTRSIAFKEPATFRVDRHSFDLGSAEGRSQFQTYIAKLLEHAGSDETPGFAKKDLRGIKEMLRLAEALADQSRGSEHSAFQSQIVEIAAAVANNHRPIIPAYVGLPDLPFRFFDSLSNPVAKGRREAANLVECPKTTDHSIIDPKPSTFWQRPKAIESADLFAGFDRTNLPRFDLAMWNYSEPKTSGGNPGCDLVSGSLRIKAKFGETHCEPFVSRLFHALGYNVEPTDYAPRLKLKYDRQFFQEFNRLPEMRMKIGLFFIPIHTFHFEREYNPFNYIKEVVLIDGTKLSAAKFEKMLLRKLSSKDRFAAENFDADFEASIDHLVTSEANIQVKDESVQSIGPWTFDGLGHEHLRELRGAGVVAAWVGWWDARFENTRLRVVDTPSGRTLRHYFNDLGAGLGRAAGTFSHSSENANDFAPTFTRGFRRFGEWRIEFTGYEPIEDNAAFKQITFDDARWMARLIAQLSEEQIRSGLKASGFSPEETAIYTRKLITRREQLLRDTRLTYEFSNFSREERAMGN